jgi:hypothetical protein
MARKIRRKGVECTECHNTHELVLIVPSRDSRPAKLFHGRHDRLGGGKCPLSDRPIGYSYWPGWAKDALGGTS